MVRSTLHKLGYRYRLHDTRLPGKPDLTFPARRIALFVHGCFWHRHSNCKRASTPIARHDYWVNKFQKTTARDHKNRSELEPKRLDGAGCMGMSVTQFELADRDKVLALDAAKPLIRRANSQFK